jgi:hypothetical protein
MGDCVEQDSLWRQVIVLKYGIKRGGWCSKEDEVLTG